MVYHSSSPNQTQKIAEELAKKFINIGGVIALSGDLGAGKTTFVQGFARGLGIKEKIISPTFVLIRQHPIPKVNRTLYHIDLYRLEEPIDLKATGLQEILQNPNNIVLIEWSEKIKNQLPITTILVSFKKSSEKDRALTIKDEATQV